MRISDWSSDVCLPIYNAALCRIPQGANALGLARHGVLPASRDANAMLAQPRGAYVVYGLEPGLDFADQAVALKALGGAQVVAFSQFACSSTRAVADVILPIGALPEIDATLTNQNGRAPCRERVCSYGLISVVGVSL